MVVSQIDSQPSPVKKEYIPFLFRSEWTERIYLLLDSTRVKERVVLLHLKRIRTASRGGKIRTHKLMLYSYFFSSVLPPRSGFTFRRLSRNWTILTVAITLGFHPILAFPLCKSAPTTIYLVFGNVHLAHIYKSNISSTNSDRSLRRAAPYIVHRKSSSSTMGLLGSPAINKRYAPPNYIITPTTQLPSEIYATDHSRPGPTGQGQFSYNRKRICRPTWLHDRSMRGSSSSHTWYCNTIIRVLVPKTPET